MFRVQFCVALRTVVAIGEYIDFYFVAYQVSFVLPSEQLLQ